VVKCLVQEISMNECTCKLQQRKMSCGHTSSRFILVIRSHWNTGRFKTVPTLWFYKINKNLPSSTLWTLLFFVVSSSTINYAKSTDNKSVNITTIFITKPHVQRKLPPAHSNIWETGLQGPQWRWRSECCCPTFEPSLGNIWTFNEPLWCHCIPGMKSRSQSIGFEAVSRHCFGMSQSRLGLVKIWEGLGLCLVSKKTSSSAIAERPGCRVG